MEGMERSLKVMLAGFGGQGLLFAGKVIATVGLLEDLEVAWLPSYGPEMRGGTAHCSVTLDEEPIGSPLIIKPDVLIALNQPSYHEFASTVPADGLILADSSLITDWDGVGDAELIQLPATRQAEEQGFGGLANIVMVGCLAARRPVAAPEVFLEAIKRCVPPRKAEMVEKNNAAFDWGFTAGSSD